MKNLYSRLIIFSFINFLSFTSCTHDMEISIPAIKKTGSTSDIRIGNILPANGSNDFDEAGQIHYQLLDTYYSSSNQPTAVSGVVSRVDSIAQANTDFISIMDQSYQSITAGRVAYLISNSSNLLHEITDSSMMSLPAQSSLSDFINDLSLLAESEEDYEIIYYFIVNYETSVIDNSTLTEYDKKIILTTSSIARYSTYMDKKRPKKNTDPDWTVFVGNFTGGVDGATSSTAKAITHALAAGIVQNQ